MDNDETAVEDVQVSINDKEVVEERKEQEQIVDEEKANSV
jgi:hypothetical protein